MNELIKLDGTDFKNIDGNLYVKLETASRGFGFTTIAKSGNEVVRWNTVYGYLKDLGVVAGSCNGNYRENCPEYIEEKVFYKLGMKAKNETAKAFQDKVADILKDIREKGMYIAPQPTDEYSDDLAIINGYKALMRKVERLESKVAIMEPKASYYDTVLACKDLVPTTIISKDYGWSAAKLNKWLNENGYQYKRGNTWVLYEKYAGKGYTSSKTHVYEDNYGHTHSQMQTQWTQAGRLFVYQELKKFGILPMIERGLIQ